MKLEKAGDPAGRIPGIPFIFEEDRLTHQDALELELRSFIRAVQERTVPLVSGEDGTRALAMAEEINREIEKNFTKVQTSWDPQGLPGMEALQAWISACGDRDSL